jgi:hypothetical protein
VGTGMTRYRRIDMSPRKSGGRVDFQNRKTKIKCTLTPVFALLLFGLALSPAVIAHAPQGERRCGWYENPTPGNVTLTDRDGSWLIAMQGSYEAKGDWPEFSNAQWVETNSGHHGYGCACLTVRTDASSHTVLSISHATPRPLAACRRDKSLHEPPHDADIDE